MFIVNNEDARTTPLACFEKKEPKSIKTGIECKIRLEEAQEMLSD